MNPILENLNRNNIINQALSIRNPEEMYQRMLEQNPQFKRFVEENKGKRPEDIARSYGIDPRLISQFVK